MNTATMDKPRAEALELLDFTPEIPCTGKEGMCGAIAVYLVRHHCPFCGYEKREAFGFACDPRWTGRSREIRRCSKCLIGYPHADGWRVVEVLR